MRAMTNEEIEDFFFRKFGWCGCGMPRLSLDRLQERLEEIEDWDNRYMRERTGDDYLVWYNLSRVGMTQHGAGEPGWLTELGREILARIKSGEIAKILDVD